MKTKKTVNQLLDLIDSLPVGKSENIEIQKVKQSLLKIKFDEIHNGFGGNVLLENYDELIKKVL